MEGQDAGGADIDRGREHEHRAVALFELVSGLDVERPKLILHPQLHRVGATPDGLVASESAVVEVKCPRAAKHMATWAYGMPREHMAQVQMEIFCCRHLGVDRAFFLSYCEQVERSRQLFEQVIMIDEDWQRRIALAVPPFIARLTGAETIPQPRLDDIPALF